MNYAKRFFAGFFKTLGAMAVGVLAIIGMFWPAALLTPESPFFPLVFVWAFAVLGGVIYAGEKSRGTPLRSSTCFKNATRPVIVGRVSPNSPTAPEVSGAGLLTSWRSRRGPARVIAPLVSRSR